ncbi:MAG TPA: VOC family protein [Ktedonobacterales bacterium]|nr:VOC family protein [Ktedonobacterales bacterium]
MKVLFVAGFGPIVADMRASQTFYADALGLSFEGDASYLFTHQLDGVKHFALWPLAAAAQSCFGTEVWPSDLPVPQGWIEFEVDDVAAATVEFECKGYRVLVAAKEEPWGQTVTRIIGPDGLLVGITWTPSLRADQAQASPS